MVWRSIAQILQLFTHSGSSQDHFAGAGKMVIVCSERLTHEAMAIDSNLKRQYLKSLSRPFRAPRIGAALGPRGVALSCSVYAPLGRIRKDATARISPRRGSHMPAQGNALGWAEKHVNPALKGQDIVSDSIIWVAFLLEFINFSKSSIGS